MVALELVTGQRLWEQNFAGISTPWVAGEWLFVVTDDARLVCLSRATGKVRWISQLRALHRTRRSEAEADHAGSARCWPATGWSLTNSRGRDRLRRRRPTARSSTTIETKTPFTLPPVVANNTLYVLDEKGRITAYR